MNYTLVNPICQCRKCQVSRYNAQQRRITVALSIIFCVLLWALVKAIN